MARALRSDTSLYTARTTTTTMSVRRVPNPLAIAGYLGPSTPTLDHLVRFLNSVRGTDKVLMVKKTIRLFIRPSSMQGSTILIIPITPTFLYFMWSSSYSTLRKSLSGTSNAPHHPAVSLTPSLRRLHHSSRTSRTWRAPSLTFAFSFATMV